MKKRYSNETGNITFRLKTSNSLKSTIILGTYLFKDYQINFSTGLKVLPHHWDNTLKIITSGADKKEMNQKLDKFKTAIINYHTLFNQEYNRIPTKEELKTIVTNAKNGKELSTVNNNKKSFDDVFQELITHIRLKTQLALSSGQKPLDKSYISSFNVMYEDLKDFSSQNDIFIDIDKFNETQCLLFQNWLLEEKELSLSTIKTRIKRLTQVLKRAFEKGYTNNRSYLQEEFSVKVPPTFHVVLTEKDIEILYNHDLSDSNRLEKVRDIFVLACHTSLRYSDVTRIEQTHIDYNTKTVNILLKKVSKTDKYKTVSFPFFGYTEEILKKYNGNIKDIAISNQNTNEYLKELLNKIDYFNEKTITREKPTNKGVIVENIKFSNKIAFHDSRRTFCTNRYIEGWDLLEIWQYTGHTNETTFKTYFKPTFEHERIRQENIKLRNEKLQKIDLQTKELELLKKQMAEMMKLIESGETEKLTKVVNLKKVN